MIFHENKAIGLKNFLSEESSGVKAKHVMMDVLLKNGCFVIPDSDELEELKRLTGFDLVVNERTTATAITEDTWGFKHTKACFRDEIIPFIKDLKDIFNNFNQYLVEELADVQKVFYQMNRTCPSINNFDPQLVAITPRKKDKKVSGSQPSGNTGLIRIQQHQNSKKHDNSNYVCINGGDYECMSSDNLCVSNSMNDVKFCAKPKKSNSKMRKSKKDIWKPTGKVFTKIGYIWRPTGQTFTIIGNVCPLTRIATTNEVPSRKPIVLESESPKPMVKLGVQIVLWYLDSSCSKHITRDRSQLTNFISKFLGTVKFGNDQVAKIMGYGDYQIGNVTHCKDTSDCKLLKQNGVVELKTNSFAIEAARTMLIYAKALCFFGPKRLHNRLPKIRSISEWDLLFQPMFDESLNPPPYVDLQAPEVFAPIPEVVAPEHAVSTGSPSSTTVTDNLTLKSAHLGNDPYFGILIPEVTSDHSSSSDDHPLENIIGDFDRPVSTRLQIHEQALFCYYDAFLTSVEPKNYKDALTQACWIELCRGNFMNLKRLESLGNLGRGLCSNRQWICGSGQTLTRCTKLKKALYGLKLLPRARRKGTTTDYKFMSMTLSMIASTPELLDTPWWEKSKTGIEDKMEAVDPCTIVAFADADILVVKIHAVVAHLKYTTFSNNVLHSRSKHIDIRFNYIKELLKLIFILGKEVECTLRVLGQRKDQIAKPLERTEVNEEPWKKFVGGRLFNTTAGNPVKKILLKLNLSDHRLFKDGGGDAFLTEEIRATDDFKEYETVFVGVDVPMNQPQPVVSTQGMHRSTPRAHRTPTLTASPQGKKRKQNVGESIQEKLDEEESEKMVEGDKDEESYASEFADSMINDDVDDFGTKIEPECHKKHSKIINDDDDQIEKEKNNVEIEKEKKDEEIEK
ncbi:hypothetical protein Tco_0800099 [Tanacetum coccineum]|uniref:Retrovirus-related Pol polyprotein from transposon TNT 1-94-like beta-barrel domain-containing protein n=1 Tax=Tanacetum coccineum TaxID=301880 RepID=A0ABQ4ZUI1_9ASTR